MKIIGWILFSLGILFCLSIIGAGVGVMLLLAGAALLVANAYLKRHAPCTGTERYRETRHPGAATPDAQDNRGSARISHSMFGR